MLRLILSSSLALGLMATTAKAEPAEELFLEYIDWIVINTDYKYNGEPLPTIQIESQEMLNILGWGPETVAEAEFTGRELPDVLAAYNENVLYLPANWQERPWLVVHELVHYMQDINGAMNKDCPMANEPEAYLLHDQWQEEHGYEESRNSGNVLYGIMLGMACYDMYGDPYLR